MINSNKATGQTTRFIMTAISELLLGNNVMFITEDKNESLRALKITENILEAFGIHYVQRILDDAHACAINISSITNGASVSINYTDHEAIKNFCGFAGKTVWLRDIKEKGRVAAQPSEYNEIKPMNSFPPLYTKDCVADKDYLVYSKAGGCSKLTANLIRKGDDCSKHSLEWGWQEAPEAKVCSSEISDVDEMQHFMMMRMERGL